MLSLKASQQLVLENKSSYPYFHEHITRTTLELNKAENVILYSSSRSRSPRWRAQMVIPQLIRIFVLQPCTHAPHPQQKTNRTEKRKTTNMEPTAIPALAPVERLLLPKSSTVTLKQGTGRCKSIVSTNV